MAPPRYVDADSPLSDTTTVSDARRFDAAHGADAIDVHGHSELQRRAALALATAARDAAELRDLLAMCGLLPAPSAGSAGSADAAGSPDAAAASDH